MYKSDLYWALTRLSLTPSGLVEGLLSTAQESHVLLQGAIEHIASGDESRVTAGKAAIREAVQPLARRFTEFSIFKTAVELDDLARRFDAVIEEHPELYDLLRFGRQAVEDLTSTFDFAAGNQKRGSSYTPMVPPALELSKNLKIYDGLREIFKESALREVEAGSQTVLEIGETHRLDDFARFIVIVSNLASAAGSAVSAASPLSKQHDEPDGVFISSIESGSPVKITLFGGNGTMKLLLAMIGDTARTAYQSFTVHGRLNQSMETLAKAKELGIESPEILAKLHQAVGDAAGAYSASFSDAGVKVDGKPIDVLPQLPPSLPPPTPINNLPTDSGALKLEGPKQERDNGQE